MESVTALSTRAEIFRRTELAHQLNRLATLINVSRLPLPAGRFAPVLEFVVGTVEDVDAVGEAIGEMPRRHKSTYWVDLETAELHVRWSTPVDEDGTGLDYSREPDDPTPVSPARVPMHTDAVTESGLVDESDGCRHECAELGVSPDCGVHGGLFESGS